MPIESPFMGMGVVGMNAIRKVATSTQAKRIFSLQSGPGRAHGSCGTPLPLLMALSFLFPAISWAFEIQAYTPGSEAEAQAKPVAQEVLRQYALPAAAGKIVAADLQPNAPTFILIQDLHCNQEIQAISGGSCWPCCARQHPICVCWRWKARPAYIPTRKLAALPDQGAKRAVAGYFLRRGQAERSRLPGHLRSAGHGVVRGRRPGPVRAQPRTGEKFRHRGKHGAARSIWPSKSTFCARKFTTRRCCCLNAAGKPRPSAVSIPSVTTPSWCWKPASWAWGRTARPQICRSSPRRTGSWSGRSARACFTNERNGSSLRSSAMWRLPGISCPSRPPRGDPGVPGGRAEAQSG